MVTGTCFAETGNQVTCIDIDPTKINKLTNGQITIYEPGLEKLFLRNLREQRLKFTTDLKEGIKDALVIFLALPTPPGEDGSADLKYILGVAKDLGRLLTGYKVIVDKSTVPVGTAEKVAAAIAQHYQGEFDVVSNPEFLREGVAVDDFMKPDRVIIGASSDKARKVMGDLYKPFVRSGNPVLYMDLRSAELAKYAANSFLATKITFMNEIAKLCELLGADVDMVRRGIGSDERIGKRFLFPGIGYGGSCFPKDVQALATASRESGYYFRILDAVMKVNEEMKLHLLPSMMGCFNGDLTGRKIAVWGLAFKPNTDDMREASSRQIIADLIEAGAVIQAYDPIAMTEGKRLYALESRVTFTNSALEACKHSDALIIVTEWQEFRSPDFEAIKKCLLSPVIFDGRNLYEPRRIQEYGFEYYSIGRSHKQMPLSAVTGCGYSR